MGKEELQQWKKKRVVPHTGVENNEQCVDLQDKVQLLMQKSGEEDYARIKCF
jgi:hypothetical protein